jgi:hypothetical protein
LLRFGDQHKWRLFAGQPLIDCQLGAKEIKLRAREH